MPAGMATAAIGPVMVLIFRRAFLACISRTFHMRRPMRSDGMMGWLAALAPACHGEKQDRENG